MVVSENAAELYERLLVLRCQTGDEAALGELMARYSPGLRLFLRKMTRQPAAADDLLQETWIDAYGKVSRLRDPGAFATWVYRIARDKAYRHLRRRPEPAGIGEDAILVEADESEFTPDEADAVRAALDELPEEQREVLVLRFVEQMTYDEIARVIDHPVGTVRSRIHYAKLALRAKLEPATNPIEERP
jgi:RNA polymerase sigma-70 factor, ECF subfamily